MLANHHGKPEISGFLFFVCLTGRSVPRHLSPDGTQLKQNAQAWLKGLYKHAGHLVYGNLKREKQICVYDRVHVVMEKLDKSWKLNDWFPGLEKSWTNHVKSHGKWKYTIKMTFWPNRIYSEQCLHDRPLSTQGWIFKVMEFPSFIM